MKEQAKYGHTLTSWNKAKEETKNILISFAKLAKPTYYVDLAHRLSPIITFTEDDAGMFAMLNEISKEEYTAGRGMLSCMAVNRDNEKPAENFYEFAMELGEKYDDREKFYIKQFEIVTDYWGKHPAQ